MKLDMDLARKILFAVEEDDTGFRSGMRLRIAIDLVDEHVLSEHICLLGEAGLLDVIDSSTKSGRSFQARRLTWEGHQFLAAARQDSLWQKAMKLLTEKVGGVPFIVLTALLEKLALSAVLGNGG